MKDISVRCDIDSAISAYLPVLQGKNIWFLIKPIPPPCLLNHLLLVFSEKPPNRGCGILAKAPTKGTWNLNLVFGCRSQDGWPPVLAFPTKRQYSLLDLELGDDIGLEDLGERPRSYPQE